VEDTNPMAIPRAMPNDSTRRVAQLDGVRGVAIALVLLSHYVHRQRVPYSQFLNLTWSGVDLFFVLSGFLICGIVVDNRDAANLFRVFYARRVCRIFPLYFLLLGAFVVLAHTPLAGHTAFRWLFSNPLPYWSYATFTQNILMGLRGEFGARFLGVTWSLAVEEQFYVVLPLLVYLLPRRALLATLTAAVLLAPVLRWSAPGMQAFVNTPWRADSLLSGACLAILVRSPRFMAVVRERYRMVQTAFLGFLAGAAVMTASPGAFGPLNHLWLAGLYSVFILIAFVHRDGYIGRQLARPILVWLGATSYGIYMYHQAVSGLLHGAIRGQKPGVATLGDFAVTALALLTTLLLATLSYYLLERPILRYGHSWHYRHLAAHRGPRAEGPAPRSSDLRHREGSRAPG